LHRFAEMKTFKNVFEPTIEEAKSGRYKLKGKWIQNYFENNHLLILELGCGRGEYSVGLAENFPNKNFIGIDIKGARMWRGAKTALENKIENVAFLRTRIEMIQSFFGEDEVDEIWITFPDPQLKRRRKKKRLTGPVFLNSYRKFMNNNGLVHLKTDNDVLFNYTLNVATFNNLTINYQTTDLHKTDSNNKLLQIKTHYEQIFLKENKNINYLNFNLPKNREIIEPPYGE